MLQYPLFIRNPLFFSCSVKNCFGFNNVFPCFFCPALSPYITIFFIKTIENSARLFYQTKSWPGFSMVDIYLYANAQMYVYNTISLYNIYIYIYIYTYIYIYIHTHTFRYLLHLNSSILFL